jgi:hypothetical protein
MRDKRRKPEELQCLFHTGWSGGRGDLRIGKRIRGERFESVRIQEHHQYLD